MIFTMRLAMVAPLLLAAVKFTSGGGVGFSDGPL
jgi:hypothetical protein